MGACYPLEPRDPEVPTPSSIDGASVLEVAPSPVGGAVGLVGAGAAPPELADCALDTACCELACGALVGAGGRRVTGCRRTGTATAR